MTEYMPEFADNKEDRCPVILVLDTSYSMTEDRKIDRLNEGIQQFREAILQDTLASLRVEVAVLTFGGSVDLVSDFTTAFDFNPPTLQATGGTPMGEAMRRALAEVEDRKAVYKAQGVSYFRPWIWLMTDGAPTDDWQSAAHEIARAESDRKATIYAVGVGDDVNDSVLSEFSTARSPIKLSGLDQFQEMFAWLGASMSSIANSIEEAGSGKEVPLPKIDGWGTGFA